MSKNDAEDYARRLYARVPANYRVYDAEQGQPLLSLLRLVGRQVANLRQDLDNLWDNFFIETCDDWVVPYLAALVGTNLLAHPVGQSNRLDVRNTVHWRRSKGTPAMLRALAEAIGGWPTQLAEFFQTLGWSQNMNHLRLDHPLTVDLHDPLLLSRLGHANDPWAYAADLRPSTPLDQTRVTPTALGIGRAGWGTPGRQQIKNLGFFVNRLQTYAIRGATPAAALPGIPPTAAPACFTFDPLFRDTPLFVEGSRAPLTRAAFDRAPWETFGKDVAVRQSGVLLATDQPPQPVQTSSPTAFTFGGRPAGLALHASAGLRLVDPRALQRGGNHFIVTAEWRNGGAPTNLGSLSTLLASLGNANAYQVGGPTNGSGRLVVTVQIGRAGLGFPGLPSSPAARFPGAVLAVRAAQNATPRQADGLYVYLPPAYLAPGAPLTYYVADDGSTYTAADLNAMSLARASEGPIYPARPLTQSTQPADEFTALNRAATGLKLLDPDRFGGVPVLIRAELFTGAFQPLGAIATVVQTGSTYPELQVPASWPAFQYAPSKKALNGDLPATGQQLLSLRLQPLTGSFVPAAELIVTNRRGQSLLVYLPEIGTAPADGVSLFVADDGSTYFAPADDVARQIVLTQQSFSGVPLARASAGQVLPIAGVWPLRQRVPVAINLCRCERNALLQFGELGIDPELGRFAFAPDDPVVGQPGLSVDYVEAFTDDVGARTFDRKLDPTKPATRRVALSGDADSPLNLSLLNTKVYANVADALAAATDGDLIEIVDSATYAAAAELLFNVPAVKKLAIRAAAGQRPCLTFYQAGGAPTVASLRIVSPLDELELNGLLISGGPIQLESAVKLLYVSACTLDPRSATQAALVAADADLNSRAAYFVCRSIAGGLRVGTGVGRLTVADSIMDQPGGVAIGGLPLGGADPPAGDVHLERVTVLGRVRCDVLTASECILDELALVDDQQAGCIRFSRFELGSVLPRRFECIPNDDQARTPPTPPSQGGVEGVRCLAPVYNARHFGRPDYAQLATACPPEIRAASEEAAEIGAFTTAVNVIRLANLKIKLQEFLPVGLSALVLGET